MKKIYLVLLLLSLISCKDEDPKANSKEEVSPAIAEVIRNDEVVIQLTDTSESFSTNLRLDEFQDRPDLIELGRKYERTALTIPTEKNVQILGGNMPASFHYKLEVERGDSVKIDLEKVRLDDKNEIVIPIFHILNTDRKWSELNFGGLLYKMNLNNKAIGIDTTKSFLFTYWNSEGIYKNAISLLDSLKTENKISENFYLEEKDNQKYEFASRKLREEDFQEQELEHAFIIGDHKISLDREDQLDNSSYVSLLRQLIDEKYFNGKRELNSKKFDFVLNNVTFLKDKQKTAVLDSYLKSIYFVEKNKFPIYLEKFNDVNQKPELKEKWSEVLTNLEENKKKLNTPNRDIAVLLNLVNDNQLTFEEILGSQKGKVVLVDFWASWCAPCIKEMPHTKTLKSMFDKENFKVIEISIDKDYAAWERASRLLGLGKADSSYIITNWEESNLHKTYSVKTIPRYLLFDKEGKIINEDAPRPSSQELKDLIRASI